ncbi:MAG: hypothetical protein ACRCSG_00025 [Cellulosilyticaceae bacterium]
MNSLKIDSVLKYSTISRCDDTDYFIETNGLPVMFYIDTPYLGRIQFPYPYAILVRTAANSKKITLHLLSDSGLKSSFINIELDLSSHLLWVHHQTSSITLTLLPSLNLNTKDGTPLFVSPLDTTDLPAILDLQNHIVTNLPITSWFMPTSSSEWDSYLNETGVVLGYKTTNNRLVAVGSLLCLGLSPDNYGHDLGFNDTKLLSTAQIDTTIVHSDFRGNRLQNYLCDLLEFHAKTIGMLYITATVSPDNHYSLKTFLDRGYSIQCIKEKYNGLERAILLKSF